MPSTLSARARLLATGGDRKTDTEDALHVARVALFRHDLRPVVQGDQTTILRLLTERRDNMVQERTRVLDRLHAVLPQSPARRSTHRSVGRQGHRLDEGHPAGHGHRQLPPGVARGLLADLRRLGRQVEDNEVEMREAIAATRTTLTPWLRHRAGREGPRASGTSAGSPPSTTSPATPAARPWTPPAATTSVAGSTPAETAR
ncbi:transposase [Streptomyces sp. NPDC014748]|uniref:IS110 family transposase n=1 Tax=Streptomyces sp. NPDC014748 TaxID=3364905 RepID=UPI0036F9A4C1